LFNVPIPHMNVFPFYIISDGSFWHFLYSCNCTILAHISGITKAATDPLEEVHDPGFDSNGQALKYWRKGILAYNSTGTRT
jgi:hypothetical protein